MECQEAEELISALVDNQLPEANRLSVERHLRECARCQKAYEWHRSLNSEIRMAGASVVAPIDLRQKIISDHRTLPIEAGSNVSDRFIRVSQSFLRPAYVSAVILIAAVAIFFLVPVGNEAISLKALQIREKIDKGQISLQPAKNTDELHEWLGHAVGNKFGPLGYDFSPLGVKPIGGTVREVDGRQILVAVFRGNGLSITCFTFLASENDAPKEAKVFFDPDTKINFYSFSRNGIQAVLHREGNVVCVLTSNMPADKLLALVRTTSPHRHRHNPTA